jgi:hypothetical protein
MSDKAEDKIEEYAHEIATFCEDCCDEANGEFIGFDHTAAKAHAIQILHRYRDHLENIFKGRAGGTYPILVQTKQ